LGQVNKISETLHNPRLDVNTAVLALKSLRSFIGTTRDSFEGYFVKVSELDDFVEYDNETQGKRKINVRLSPLDSVQTLEIEMSSSNKF
jgi:translation initiation factor IF-1